MLRAVRWGEVCGVGAWKRVMAARVVGVGLSSRANFLLVMPQLFAALTIKVGWRAALNYVAGAGAAFAAVKIPFWLFGPAGFAALHAPAPEIADVQTLLPIARPVAPARGGCTAVVAGDIELSWWGGLYAASLQRMGRCD